MLNLMPLTITHTLKQRNQNVGECAQNSKMIDRQVTNDVSLFEAQIPFNPPHGKLIIDPKGRLKVQTLSCQELRVIGGFEATGSSTSHYGLYLMRDVLGDGKWPENNVPFAVLYAFIRDRLRAIRTDLTLQNCKTIQKYKDSRTFNQILIAAGHLLCEEERAAL